MEKKMKRILAPFFKNIREDLENGRNKLPEAKDWLAKAVTLNSFVEDLVFLHESRINKALKEGGAVNASGMDPYIWKLLAGYCLENLTKGIIQVNTKVLKKTHDLIHLIDSISIVTDETERAFLKSLEECVLWKAKYPTPLADNQIKLKKSVGPNTLPRLPGDSGIGYLAEIQIYRKMYSDLINHEIYKDIDLSYREINLKEIMHSLLKNES